MALTELSPAYVTPYDPRRRAPERRPPRDPSPRYDPPAAPPPSDAALLAPVFRPDLSQLAVSVESPPPGPPVDFDNTLGQLVLAVREGDLSRARAALDALETEMLVERSAGNTQESGWLRAPERLACVTSRLSAVAPPTHAADAAYETLAHYLNADGPA